MKTNIKKITFAMVALASSALAIPALAQNLCAGKNNYCYNFAANIQIPHYGIEFLGNFTKLSELIGSLFKFALILSGFGALVMFTVGAIIYTTGGDNQSRTDRGKKFMYNAIFGLVIALLSFLILNTINPNITSNNNINLPDLSPVLSNDESGGCLISGQCVPSTQSACIKHIFYNGDTTCGNKPISKPNGHCVNGINKTCIPAMTASECIGAGDFYVPTSADKGCPF